jgi:hypothetical protein
LKAGSHPDAADACVVSALDVDLAVADEKRTGKIDSVFSRGLDDHAWRRLATRGRLAGNVWAEIRRLDQTIPKLAPNLRFNSAILLDCKEPAADAALVRDDDEFEPIRFQAPQCLRYAGKNLYVLRIGSINAIFHDRAVAIDKYGGRQRIIHVRCPLENSR